MTNETPTLVKKWVFFIYGSSPVTPRIWGVAGAPFSWAMHSLLPQHVLERAVAALEIPRKEIVDLDDLLEQSDELLDFVPRATQLDAAVCACGQSNVDKLPRLLALDLDDAQAVTVARALDGCGEVLCSKLPAEVALLLEDDQLDRERVRQRQLQSDHDKTGFPILPPNPCRELRGDLKHRRCSFRTIASPIGCL